MIGLGACACKSLDLASKPCDDRRMGKTQKQTRLRPRSRVRPHDARHVARVRVGFRRRLGKIAYVNVRLDAMELIERGIAGVLTAWHAIIRRVLPAIVIPWCDVPIGAVVVTRDPPHVHSGHGVHVDRVLLRTSPDHGMFIGTVERAHHGRWLVTIDDDLAFVESELWSALRARRGSDLVLVAARRVSDSTTAADIADIVERALTARGAS